MKKVLLLVFILAISGCTSSAVESGDTVSVLYTGSLQDGTVFDSNVDGEPLTFVVGAGQMIAGFDSGVRGLAVGEERAILVPPAMGYGMHDETKVVEVNNSIFENIEKLELGAMVSNEQGLQGTIVEINNETVMVDFNHFLAGQTLVFEIKVLELTKG
jgi:peptidylprolyl isomerase